MENSQVAIILHGWQSSKEKWEKVKESLERQGIKTIVPDLPGFKKEAELNRVWNLDDYVGWLEKFSSEIAEPFFIIGHSFGGRLALKFGAKHPEKLRGLILVSSAGIKSPENPRQKLMAAAAKIGNKFSFLPFFEFLRKFFYKFIVRKSDYCGLGGALKETFKKVIAEDLTPFLSQIKTPALIIWGEKDEITPLKDAYLMNKMIPNSKMEILRGVGHAPHLEIPEKLSQIIIDFVIQG